LFQSSCCQNISFAIVSFYYVFAFLGDLLATTLTGLERLLTMSYGCGEQNMLRFSPNVYVSAYLTITKRLTDEIDKNVILCMYNLTYVDMLT
jgi:hypothetical protein